MKLFWYIIFLLHFTNSVFASSVKENTNYAIVFMYHNFGVNKYPSTNIRLEQFQAQLDYLDKNNYNIWPLSKVLYYVKNKYTIPKKTVSLTIDDAYISTYTHAYPMLKEKAFPYTVFVNTNPIGRNAVSYMTWEQMREMQRYGAEFANHSSTHDYLVAKKYETQSELQNRIKKEVTDAQTLLQKELGNRTNESPKLLSYPFGEYSKESAEYIKSLGYIGVAQTSGVVSEHSDFRNIPRFAMNESFAHMEGFITKLNTLPLRIIKADPWEPRVRFNPPKLKIELESTVKNLGCYTSDGKPINIRWRSQTELEVQAPQALKGERDRYTCTAENGSGKFYWYSHLWILDND